MLDNMTGQLSPRTRYERDLLRPGFIADPAQQAAVAELQDLFERLVAHKPPSWLVRLGRLWPQSRKPECGLYLWGGVGRGKTYLMDAFYESLPFEHKQRTHFYRFMREVHRQLKIHAGASDPLEKVAAAIATKTQVLCFDEFFVTDIADAMILAGLLAALFRRGVVLVATSNIEPHNLYADGLQRERFLPTIALLQRHTKVVNVDGSTDYRLRTLESAKLYYCPLDEAADASLDQCFARLMVKGSTLRERVALKIEGRSILALREADDVVWFEFAELCDSPRSQNDYIELAREYHTVLLSNVPRFDRRTEDQARRFIILVDEFYNRCVKLILSAAVPLDTLYAGRQLKFEFERSVSRLREMQSHEYLASPHKPD